MRPVILDIDPGVDDALALLMAVHSPELEIIGLTTMSGNVTLDQTTENALKVLELVGRTDIPVCMGRSDPWSAKRATPTRCTAQKDWAPPSCPTPRPCRPATPSTS